MTPNGLPSRGGQPCGPRQANHKIGAATDANAGWFAAVGPVAVLIRPDLYVYGCATVAGDLAALLDHLGAAPCSLARV
jgi:hypothetical protein